MKKISTFACLITILFFANCGGGGEDKATTSKTEKTTEKGKTTETEKTTEKEQKNKKATTAELLIGDWELVKETNLGGEEVKGDIKTTLSITKDFFTESYGDAKTKYKYKLGKHSQITPNAIDGLMYFEEGKEMVEANGIMPYSILSISENQLVLEFMGQKTYKRK